MALEGGIVQSMSQSDAVSRGALAGTRPLLPACCVCGLVGDEISAVPGHISWVPLKTYRKTHKTNSADCLFTHTYCPACLGQARANMLQFFRSQQDQSHRSDSTP